MASGALQDANARNRQLREIWQERVLTCDGGGVRGYALLLVLEALMVKIAEEERLADRELRLSRSPPIPEPSLDPLQVLLPLPCHYFDYVVGTSTGGLIAIMLGRLRMNVRNCRDEYKILGEQVFAHKRYWYFNRYNHDILIRCIKEVVKKYCLDPGSSRLGGDKMYHPIVEEYGCRTVVLAIKKTEEENDSAFPFSSYHIWQESNNERQLSFVSPRDPKAVHIYNAAWATAAAPGFFRPARVCGEYFMDGALKHNNPSDWAWTHIWRRYSERKFMTDGPNPNGTAEPAADDNQPPSAHRRGGSENRPTSRIGAFVSLGTGVRAQHTAFRKGDPVRKLRQVLRYSIGEMTDTEGPHIAVEGRAREHSDRLYFRFNPDGIEKIRLDHCKSHGRTFAEMDTECRRYLQEADTCRQINECAQLLVRQRRGRLPLERLLSFPDLTTYDSR